MLKDFSNGIFCRRSTSAEQSCLAKLQKNPLFSSFQKAFDSHAHAPLQLEQPSVSSVKRTRCAAGPNKRARTEQDEEQLEAASQAQGEEPKFAESKFGGGRDDGDDGNGDDNGEACLV